MAVAARLEKANALADAYDVRLLVQQREQVCQVLGEFTGEERRGDDLGRCLRALVSALEVT